MSELANGGAVEYGKLLWGGSQYDPYHPIAHMFAEPVPLTPKKISANFIVTQEKLASIPQHTWRDYITGDTQQRPIEPPVPIDYTTWSTAALFNELAQANGTDMWSCDNEAVDELAKRLGLKQGDYGDWEEADE